MEVDSEESSLKMKALALEELSNGPLSSSIAKLSGSLRGIPSDEDFHFFYNFQEFKAPIRKISEKSELMLKSISLTSLWAKPLNLPEDSEDAYDWLVNINDEVFERFDVSVDEFQRSRKEKNGDTERGMDSENGFQLIYGKKKKKGVDGVVCNIEKDVGSPSSVKMVSKDEKTTGSRPRVPFHIPTIRRSQDEFNILVNNSNEAFQHVWLEKSEDGTRFIHPLEKLLAAEFIDRTIGATEQLKPLPLECTPFKLVEEVKELKQLAAKLCCVDEFAVDLEHNQYRSFQGITCLMQISTRTEDFVVDTLKLRVHIGPYLRDLFKDPSKIKVMHGADRDIVWLQRDFGIYVCNLFDTGQASRVLHLERNSLEYLLHHFCGVTANKEYQNADWRLRPIPDEMLKYAREDTHYLLHIYDLMRGSLLTASSVSENGDDLLLEVYKRSYDVCMQLYEKEILTDTSYLYLYGLQGAGLNSVQLSIVAGLCEWRDAVARADDESTGFILPNKSLLEIAIQMPRTTKKLQWLVKSKHPYVERNLKSVLGIIMSSIENASAFESVSEQLKNGSIGRRDMSSRNVVVAAEFEVLPTPKDPLEPERVIGENVNIINEQAKEHILASTCVKKEPLQLGTDTGHGRCEEAKKILDGCSLDLPEENIIISGERRSTKVVTGATIEMLKKPSRAFGALLGKSSSKRKLNPDPNVEIKLEQIKSSVILPFHSFSISTEQLGLLPKAIAKPVDIPDPTVSHLRSDNTKVEDVIMLENDSNEKDSQDSLPAEANGGRENDNTVVLESDAVEDEPTLSDLSFGFQKLSRTMNRTKNAKQTVRSPDVDDSLPFKPFDYMEARKQRRFGEDEAEENKDDYGHGFKRREKSKKKPVISKVPPRAEVTKEMQPGRRRLAFPSSGNRSATFK